MRGKLVVIGMLFAAAALFLYSVWFANAVSPIDERFNMRRRPLPDETPGYLILRERAGDYLRTALNVDTLDAPESERHGAAEYDVDGKTVRLEVRHVGDTTPTLDMVFEGFLTRAGGIAQYATLKLHPEAQIPYGLGTYSGNTYTYYEIGWINGNWILLVSTRDAGQEALLRFANGYIY